MISKQQEGQKKLLHYGNKPFLQAAVDAHSHEGKFAWVVEVVRGAAEVGVGELVDFGQCEAGLIRKRCAEHHLP